MTYQIIILASVLAYANAGIIGAPVAYSSAPAVSHYSYSSPALVSPGVAYSAGPALSQISYASPSLSYGVPTLSSQSSNIYRSYGNLGQISTYSKNIDTPFSSVRNADLRVNNHGLRITGAAPIAYAPAAQLATSYHAPHAVAAGPAIGVTYSAAPAASHLYYNALGVNYAY